MKAQFSTRMDLLPMHDYVCNPMGHIVVDFVGRFENLEKDFNKVCEHLNLDNNKLEKHNSSEDKEKSYRDSYNDKMRKVMEEKYKLDLKMFGYEF
jgi:hypothetical protein